MRECQTDLSGPSADGLDCLSRITQSRSFQILEGWISESEKTVSTSPRQSSSLTLDPSPGTSLTFLGR